MKTYKKLSRIVHSMLRRTFYTKILRLYFTNCRSIIDIGCGRGDFLLATKDKVEYIVGCDIDIRPLTVLRLHGFDVVQCDVIRLPFRSNSFDGAFFSHVIEHIPFSDAIPTLKEIKRVISDKLVIITPSLH